MTNKKFIIFSEYAEILDLAIHLQNLGHEVVMYIPSNEHKKIGDGIVKKTENWLEYLKKDYIWVFDGCNAGKLQDELRKKGEFVFGGSEQTDKLENDRQLGNKLFKKAGFKQPESKNFKSIDDAIAFITENKDTRYILKQNGSAPKHLNHMGKFDENVDMLYHLNGLKKSWSESEYGPIDFDLMEVVSGLEVAVSAFFNGKDWLRNEEGKVVGYLNFEEKKECNGNTGETTGEMGTTFIGCTEDNKLFKDIILRDEITNILKKLDYRGVFDINCIKTDKGITALEPTCRFGIPATSYEFIEAMETDTGIVIEAIAKGLSIPLELKMGVGVVMVIASKPYPVEADLENMATSIGEKLWILKDNEPIKDFTKEQQKHIHLENFFKDDDGNYLVATKNGYLLTVTAHGDTISQTRNDLIKYIKDNIYILGIKYRTDIGERVEEYFGITPKEDYEKKLKEAKDKMDAQVKQIKETLKKTLYESE